MSVNLSYLPRPIHFTRPSILFTSARADSPSVCKSELISFIVLSIQGSGDSRKPYFVHFHVRNSCTDLLPEYGSDEFQVLRGVQAIEATVWTVITSLECPASTAGESKASSFPTL